MKNKIICLLTAIVMTLTLSACGSQKSESPKDEYNPEPYGIHHAVITVENYGEIHLELDGDTAPVTVKNFVELAKSGFYDGLTFHRIIESFMIQGGDPEGTGLGGSEQEIIGEFKSNGIENDISHKRGVISMARLGEDPNSASSQFFIMHRTSTHLDGDYAAFGHVTEGMTVVDKIASEAIVEDDNGTVAAKNQPVIKSIVITD